MRGFLFKIASLRMPKNLILIGPMGAGKSSIGRRLAKQLNKKFYDCDRILEERTGVAITTIFELEGEDGFRARETKVLEKLVKSQNAVIATGGGVILKAKNLSLIRRNSIVIYLKTSLDSQIERTKHDKKRPLIQTRERRATLEKLARSRNPIYEQVADITINTDGQSIDASLEKMASQLDAV